MKDAQNNSILKQHSDDIKVLQKQIKAANINIAGLIDAEARYHDNLNATIEALRAETMEGLRAEFQKAEKGLVK